MEDIDKQYLLTEEKQMALPLLFTARQYGKADEVYGKVFNSLDIFETCAKLLWNQTVHHNALMHCKDFEGEEQERFRKLYVEGLEEAEKKSNRRPKGRSGSDKEKSRGRQGGEKTESA